MGMAEGEEGRPGERESWSAGAGGLYDGWSDEGVGLVEAEVGDGRDEGGGGGGPELGREACLAAAGADGVDSLRCGRETGGSGGRGELNRLSISERPASPGISPPFRAALRRARKPGDPGQSRDPEAAE